MNSERSLRPRGQLAVFVCGTLLSLSVATPPLHAQGKNARRAAASENQRPPQGELSPEDATEYRRLVETALSEFKLTNWPEARLLFRRAHELNPSARTLRGIGMVSYEMRDYVPAVLAFSEALLDERQPLTPAQRKECEELLSLARTFVASYDVSREPATLELTVDGAPAAYDKDGRLLMAFGEHTLQASALGHQRSTLTVSVQGNEHHHLQIVLPLEVPQAATPVAAVSTQTGPRALGAPGRDSPSSAARARHGGLRYTWVALGASAAFGAAAAVTWSVAVNKFQDLKNQCRLSAALGDPCVRGELKTDSVQRLERLTNATLGLSAASLVTAAILMPLEWPREHRLALEVGARQLSLRGSF